MTHPPVVSGPPGVLTRRQIRERTVRALATRAQTRSERRRQELLEYVVSINMGIANGVVSRYIGRRVGTEDLQEVVRAALTRAARDFEPDCRDEFLSYALPLVRRELGVHVRDRAQTARPPLGS
jgi:RNA polymerase sigma-B factor